MSAHYYEGINGFGCVVCAEPAAYSGNKFGNNTVVMLFCIDHGPAAQRDWVVRDLKELQSFTKWKAKNKPKPPMPTAPPGLFNADG
jgi:hypothetical protein